MAAEDGRRGSLLIITLWLVIILGALATAVARYLSVEVQLTKYRVARQEARALARSGIYLAMNLLQEDPTPQYDWRGDAWAQPLSITPAIGQQVSLVITDEERKINLNTATALHLSQLLGQADLAQTLVDYHDPSDPAEDRLTDDPPYYAKNDRIVVLEEVSDVPGMEPGLYETLLAQATPHTEVGAAGGPLNINTVTPEVLETVGIRPQTIEAIVQFRDSPNGPFQEAGLMLAETLQAQGLVLDDETERNLLVSDLFRVSSRVFTVVSEAVVERPAVRVRIQAAIQRPAEGSGISVPQVIAWREGLS